MLTKINIVIVVAAVILFITKPSQADIENNIKSAIIENIDTAQINKGSDFFSNFITLTCKLDAESCYKITRANTQVFYNDLYIIQGVVVIYGNQKRNCIAALRGLHCPSFIN